MGPMGGVCRRVEKAICITDRHGWLTEGGQLKCEYRSQGVDSYFSKVEGEFVQEMKPRGLGFQTLAQKKKNKQTNLVVGSPDI